MKKNKPSVLALLIILLASYVVWQFARLVIGTGIANQTGRQLLDADRINRAFSDYPKSHDGRYPSFQDSNEATGDVASLLKVEASKVDSEGDPYTTLSELEDTARKAIWNLSLSGAKALGPVNSSPAWVFYFQRSDHRFVVAFLDGKVTIQNSNDLSRTIRGQASGH